MFIFGAVALIIADPIQMNLIDTEILQQLKKGDKAALTVLYNTYWKPLFIASYNLLKNKEICEEIIQDIFIEIWNNRAELEIKVSLKSYLYACVRYKVFSEFRKNKIEQLPLFENLEERFQCDTPETKMMHEELEIHVRKIIATLPEKCKKVYELSRNEQLSHKEIAERLAISTKTVENHITKALRILRISLGTSFSLELVISVLHDYFSR
ncbi:MAG: RNA polymerase sigma-70 factor [Flavobacterium sp.]